MQPQHLPPGIAPIGIDFAVADLRDALLLGIGVEGDIVVAHATFASKSVLGMREQQLRATTWRNNGPVPHRTVRTVASFATVASIALERDVRLARAFLVASWRWQFTGPQLSIDGHWLRPTEAVALLPAADADRDTAFGRVGEVREQYGQLRSDIAYRIENSALFDTQVPLTQRFEANLARWESLSESLDAVALGQLAAQVRVSFDAARANAETLGLAHLPATARDDARRAAGAARIAAAAATPGERAAAQEQLIAILSSLGLAWLPDPARGALRSA